MVLICSSSHRLRCKSIVLHVTHNKISIDISLYISQTLQGVVTEAVVAFLIALVPARTAVVPVGEQVDAAPAAARAAVQLADLVAAAAVVGAASRVHALPAAARRARAARSEAHGG